MTDYRQIRRGLRETWENYENRTRQRDLELTRIRHDCPDADCNGESCPGSTDSRVYTATGDLAQRCREKMCIYGDQEVIVVEYIEHGSDYDDLADVHGFEVRCNELLYSKMAYDEGENGIVMLLKEITRKEDPA